MNIIIIRKNLGGWQVRQHKDEGLNKGETVLASLCGGALGKQLAAVTAKYAAETCMADAVVFEDPSEDDDARDAAIYIEEKRS